MRVKIAAVTTASIVLSVCASLSHYRGRTSSTVHAASAALSAGGGFWQFDPLDSPINIGGGSIHGNLHELNAHWTIVSSKEIHAQSKNIGFLEVEGISNLNSGGRTEVPVPGGWIIHISNRTKGNGNPKADAILIYSNSSCNGRQLDPQQVVCLQTRNDSRWSVLGNGQLRFHDNVCDGPQGGNEDPACDVPMTVQIENPRGTVKPAGTCNAGTCIIGIGKQ